MTIPQERTPATAHVALRSRLLEAAERAERMIYGAPTKSRAAYRATASLHREAAQALVNNEAPALPMAPRPRVRVKDLDGWTVAAAPDGPHVRIVIEDPFGEFMSATVDRASWQDLAGLTF
jgi:hypothetical protein